MKVILWRGYHSAALLDLLNDACQGKSLLILCPPHLKSYEFLDFLPPGEVSLVGEWEKEDKAKAESKASSRKTADYPTLPQVGVFTSGTMSFVPNLVLFSKENVEHSLQSILDLFDPSWAERIICYPQPFHIFGLTLGYVQSLLWKKPLITPEGRYQKSFHDKWINADRDGLLTLGAPVHFFDLLQRAPKDLKIARSSSVCGGARVSPELWKQFQEDLGIAYPSIGYGATEACPGLTHLPPGVAPKERGDIGQWLKGVEVFNHQNGFEFSGPNMCLARVIETHEGRFELEFPTRVLIRDDLARSGDRIIYKGRCDLKMNRGGEKFSLELIEEKIQQALGVPVLASVLPDLRLGEKLGICLQSLSGASDLKAKCKEFIALEFQWIVQDHEIHVLDNFPVNANGKWDRRQALECFKV